MSLENVLVERMIMGESLKSSYVLYLDMLGFSALTEEHPGTMMVEIDTNDSTVSTSSTASAARFGAFHAVLDRIAAGHDLETQSPHRMMIFSDCAFLVYENALQAALSACEAMRWFLGLKVPVRMAIAYGTCHPQRFSSDTYQDFSLTRAVFYGSAIVRAAETEKRAGKGCRIFVHTSVDSSGLELMRGRVPTLPLASPKDCSKFELGYLYDTSTVKGAVDPAQMDKHLWASIETMFTSLKKPVDTKVCEQYTNTFEAINRMRAQLSRPQFSDVADPTQLRRI